METILAEQTTVAVAGCRICLNARPMFVGLSATKVNCILQVRPRLTRHDGLTWDLRSLLSPRRWLLAAPTCCASAADRIHALQGTCRQLPTPSQFVTTLTSGCVVALSQGAPQQGVALAPPYLACTARAVLVIVGWSIKPARLGACGGQTLSSATRGVRTVICAQP